MKRTGHMEYCLHVGPHEVYMTKFRVPKGTNLPDVVIDADYEKLKDYIDGKGGPVTTKKVSKKKKKTTR